MRFKVNLVFAIVLASVVCVTTTAVNSKDIVEPEQLTSELLDEIVNEDPTGRRVASVQFSYIAKSSEHYFGVFDAKPRIGEAREWTFSMRDRSTGQKYDYSFSEPPYRSLVQLCISNDVSEMQPFLSEDFDRNIDYWMIKIKYKSAWARIGYNVRDVESEPFFEVVDFIEANFVAPALLNPVDKWWDEE